MIIKISASGDRASGLVHYLVGPGHGNEHTNQKMLDGGTVYYSSDITDSAVRMQISDDLMAFQRLNKDVKVKGGAVWHCSLSVSTQDGVLPEQTWSQIGQDFMREMGFDNPNKAQARWGMFHHGQSAEGNDHIHIVMNRVRADGTKVDTYRDMIKASKVVAGLEIKYGLSQLAGRTGGGNVQATNKTDHAVARKAGIEPERITLERLVRASAEASTGEAEFVRRLRAQGIEVRAFRQADEVTGYSVKIPGSKLAFAGGKLARDLSLPALRRRWEQAAAAQRSAAHEWVKGRAGQPVGKYGPETRANMPPREKVVAELDALRAQIIEARTAQQIREASRQLAGALAAGAQVDGKLVKPSRQIAAWAPRGGSRRRFQMASVTMALLVAAQGNGLASDLVMIKMVTDALMELYRLHRMRAQAVHFHRSTQPRGVPMTEPDGMEEVLDSGMQAGVVAVAAGVQQLAQMGQDKLIEEAKIKEAEARGNRGVGWDPSAVTFDANGQPGPDQGPPMTQRQEETLHQIAGRAGLDVTELRLGDMSYGDLSVAQAAKMIDALGDPKYGSSGSARHTLNDIRAARSAGTTMTPPVAAAGSAQQYARTSQVQGPGAGKNQNASRKV